MRCTLLVRTSLEHRKNKMKRSLSSPRSTPCSHLTIQSHTAGGNRLFKTMTLGSITTLKKLLLLPQKRLLIAKSRMTSQAIKPKPRTDGKNQGKRFLTLPADAAEDSERISPSLSPFPSTTTTIYQISLAIVSLLKPPVSRLYKCRPSTKLQFPFPLFPISLARFPSAQLRCVALRCWQAAWALLGLASVCLTLSRVDTNKLAATSPHTPLQPPKSLF